MPVLFQNEKNTETFNLFQSDKKNIVHEMSSESRKVLGPLGRPPLPPKRRMSPASLKQGNLGLRLSPSPSASRIDIDSIGVPLVIASAESKPEKQQMPRSPALKLSGKHWVYNFILQPNQLIQ